MGYHSHTGIRAVMPYVLFVLLLGIAIGLSGCGDESRKPIPTLAPTSDATASPTADAALEELFWIATDVAGIPRDTPFENALFQLAMILFNDYDKRLAEIEGLGVDPFLNWPYCIDAISGVYAITALSESNSPLEAIPDVNHVIDVIVNLEISVIAARKRGKGASSPAESKQKCDQFEAEVRMQRGLPPIQR